VAKLAGAYGSRTVAFGFSELLPLRAKNLHFNYVTENELRIPRGREWTLVTPEMEFIVSQPAIIGESHITASLAACAVVYGLGFNLEKAVEALHAYRTPPGRLSLISGKNKSIIIDDTYNSSPVAAQAGLALLASLETPGKKIAVFGDMMELGKFTQEAHETLGKQCVGSCDMLVTVGIRAKYTDEGAKEAGYDLTKIKHFDTAEQAGAFLSQTIQTADIVLIKGSQSVRLEKAVKMVMAEPEKASELLVRQEKEWEGR
jgi:UDP-N-acetylmuramoyl-tripeptide--D-alanyl-D-alanine ligase